MATGLSIILLSLVLRFTLLNNVNLLFSLSLIVPLYIGFLSLLEGSMSFCVLHAARGTYDLSEPHGMPRRTSPTSNPVGHEESKKLDQRKARRMHIEALSAGLILGVLLTLA
jgi:hypothetical protein